MIFGSSISSTLTAARRRSYKTISPGVSIPKEEPEAEKQRRLEIDWANQMEDDLLTAGQHNHQHEPED